MFAATETHGPDGNPGQYPDLWSSTTNLDGFTPESHAPYVPFWEGMREMGGTLMAVHGAGYQDSDPQDGAPRDYPAPLGPQGDIRYVYDHARCVRDLD